MRLRVFDVKRLRTDLYAYGEAGLPEQIHCQEKMWPLETVFKHDFFACTGCYLNEQSKEKIVLKISRLQSFLGVPCAWFGHFLRNREMNLPAASRRGIIIDFRFTFRPKERGIKPKREKLKKLLDNSRPCRDNCTHIGLFLLEVPLNISRFC